MLVFLLNFSYFQRTRIKSFQKYSHAYKKYQFTITIGLYVFQNLPTAKQNIHEKRWESSKIEKRIWYGHGI